MAVVGSVWKHDGAFVLSQVDQTLAGKSTGEVQTDVLIWSPAKATPGTPLFLTFPQKDAYL